MANRMAGLQLGRYSMGDRSIQGGTYENLSTLGLLEAKDAILHNLSVMGEAQTTDCKIDVLQVAGTMQVQGGRIDVASIAGELSLDHVDCGSLHVMGELHAIASKCRILRYGKSIQFGLFVFANKHRPLKVEEISAETLENFFPLTLDGRQQFKNIINCGQLYAQADLACDKFFSFSLLSAQEINADMIYLYPCAHVKVKELHGALVIVDPSFDAAWLKDVVMDIEERDMRNGASCKMVDVDIIEADEVVLDYITCKIVRAKKVTIGPNANISCIEYEETCEIHPQAKVKEHRKI